MGDQYNFENKIVLYHHSLIFRMSRPLCSYYDAFVGLLHSWSPSLTEGSCAKREYQAWISRRVVSGIWLS